MVSRAALFTALMASLAYRVPDVVALRPEEKMTRIDAISYVAPMTDQ